MISYSPESLIENNILAISFHSCGQRGAVVLGLEVRELVFQSLEASSPPSPCSASYRSSEETHWDQTVPITGVARLSLLLAKLSFINMPDQCGSEVSAHRIPCLLSPLEVRLGKIVVWLLNFFLTKPNPCRIINRQDRSPTEDREMSFSF